MFVNSSNKNQFVFKYTCTACMTNILDITCQYMCQINAYLLYNWTQSEHRKGRKKIVYLYLGHNRQNPVSIVLLYRVSCEDSPIAISPEIINT